MPPSLLYKVVTLKQLFLNLAWYGQKKRPIGPLVVRCFQHKIIGSLVGHR